ncbi:Ctr copper transporter family-domain-containing protein [Xylariaceae sp. FL0804]|nr:Ctr copper transporter family-domain-containing protein [Xylariaceae sp. FL0804]
MDMSTMTTSMTSTDMAGMTMTSSASMSTSTSSSSMDMGSTIMMSSSEMAMVFFQAVTTPLFSMSFTPAGKGSYAGTCVFLVVLALAHRFLMAARHVFFDSRRRMALSAARHHQAARMHNDLKDVPSLNSDDGSAAPEALAAHVRNEVRGHPFAVATETVRALFEVVIGGVGYLLMLAVMTMNVGYFLSVLGGIFLGAFLVGRFGAVDNHDFH